MNYGFVIDNRRCIGCHACTVACKAEHDTPIGVNRTWVKYVEKGVFPDARRTFTVHRCNHCEDAPCVAMRACADCRLAQSRGCAPATHRALGPPTPGPSVTGAKWL